MILFNFIYFTLLNLQPTDSVFSTYLIIVASNSFEQLHLIFTLFLYSVIELLSQIYRVHFILRLNPTMRDFDVL